MDCVDKILDLFDTRGAGVYFGEPVTQQEHALQTAHLAARDGAPDSLIAAALLHDIGHLLGPEDNPALRGVDGRHEDSGCAWLARHFGPAVTEPIRLHVNAKRYLCATDAAYLRQLSEASLRSLELQGGPFSTEDVIHFEANAFHDEAVCLRRWDDAAKIPALQVPGLRDYIDLLRRVMGNIVAPPAG
jgi:gamma-butyrobetaine dioxygenase